MGVPMVSPRDGLFLKDDFLANDSVADAAVGELNWEIAAIGNASTISIENGEVDAHGILKDTTAATADGDGETYSLHADTVVLGPKNGHFAFKARLDDQIADNNFIVGLTAGSTETTPTDGIYVLCDGGVITLEADSADHGDRSAAAAGDNSLTSGTTMVVTTWHEFEVRWSGENAQGGPAHVQLWVDDYLVAEIKDCQIDDDETLEPKIVHWQDSGGGLAVELDLDYVEFFIAR